MFEFLDDIEKLLEIFNFNFDFMKNFDFLNKNEDIFYFQGQEDFLPSIRSKLFNFEEYKNFKIPNISDFEGMLFKEDLDDFIQKPINQNELLSEILLNQSEESNSLAADFGFLSGKNNFFLEEEIFDDSKFNFDFIKPIFENNFDIENFKKENIEIQKQKLNKKFPTNISEENMINKTTYVTQKETIEPDIDYIGSEIAKRIEQASVNRSIASAY